MEAKYKNKQWLKSKINKEYSTREIAKEANCFEITIRQWCGKFDLHTKIGRSIKLNKNLMYLINASLLGDGKISVVGENTAMLQFGYKEKEYAIYIKKLYEFAGLQISKLKKYETKENGKEYISFEFHSVSYRELLLIYYKWYRQNKKRRFRKYIVPENIKLNEQSYLIWYLDDGNINQNKYVSFATNSFNKKSIKLLVEKLKRDLNIDSKIIKHKNVGLEIQLDNYNSSKFLEKIGSCPVDCYKYKWNWHKARKYIKSK